MADQISMNEDTFHVITSLRSDSQLHSNRTNDEFSADQAPSQFYLFSYHHDRMLAAVSDFSWPVAIQVLDGTAGLAFLEQEVCTHLLQKYGDDGYGSPLKVARSRWKSIITDDCRYVLPYRILERLR